VNEIRLQVREKPIFEWFRFRGLTAACMKGHFIVVEWFKWSRD